MDSYQKIGLVGCMAAAKDPRALIKSQELVDILDLSVHRIGDRPSQ